MGSVTSLLRLRGVTSSLISELLGVLLAGNAVIDAAETSSSTSSASSSSSSCSCAGSIVASVLATFFGTALICFIVVFILYHRLRQSHKSSTRGEGEGEGHGLENDTFGREEDPVAAAAAAVAGCDTADTVTLSRHHHGNHQVTMVSQKRQLSGKSLTSCHVTDSTQSLNRHVTDSYTPREQTSRQWHSLPRHTSRTNSAQQEWEESQARDSNQLVNNSEFTTYSPTDGDNISCQTNLRKWTDLSANLELDDISTTEHDNCKPKSVLEDTHSNDCDANTEGSPQVLKHGITENVEGAWSGGDGDIIMGSATSLVDEQQSTSDIADDRTDAFTPAATTATLQQALASSLAEDADEPITDRSQLSCADVVNEHVEEVLPASAKNEDADDEQLSLSSSSAAASLAPPPAPTAQHPLTMDTLGDYFINANPSLIEEMVEEGDVVSLVSFPHHTHSDLDLDPDDLDIIDLPSSRRRSLSEHSNASSFWQRNYGNDDVSYTFQPRPTEVNNNDWNDVTSLPHHRRDDVITGVHVGSVNELTSGVVDSLIDAKNDYEIKTILGLAKVHSSPPSPLSLLT